MEEKKEVHTVRYRYISKELPEDLWVREKVHAREQLKRQLQHLDETLR